MTGKKMKGVNPDPRPARSVMWREVLCNLPIDSILIVDLSARLVALCAEQGLTDDEIKTAKLEVHELGYDPCEIRLMANAMETEKDYQRRLSDWQDREDEREEIRREAAETLKRERERDEAEFERLKKKLGK